MRNCFIKSIVPIATASGCLERLVRPIGGEQEELIPRNEIRTNLSVAVVAEPKTLVNSTQPWTRSLAIQTQIATTKSLRALCRPTQQCGRDAAAGQTTADCNTMYKRRL